MAMVLEIGRIEAFLNISYISPNNLPHGKQLIKKVFQALHALVESVWEHEVLHTCIYMYMYSHEGYAHDWVNS